MLYQIAQTIKIIPQGTQHRNNEIKKKTTTTTMMTTTTTKQSSVIWTLLMHNALWLFCAPTSYINNISKHTYFRQLPQKLKFTAFFVAPFVQLISLYSRRVFFSLLLLPILCFCFFFLLLLEICLLNFFGARSSRHTRTYFKSIRI